MIFPKPDGIHLRAFVFSTATKSFENFSATGFDLALKSSIVHHSLKIYASTMSKIQIERFEGQQITEGILKAAAMLFSENYGIWGPLAETKMGPFAKKGARVKMSTKVLKQQCMPTEGRTI